MVTRLDGHHPGSQKKALTTVRLTNQDLITFKKLHAKARCLLRSSKKRNWNDFVASSINPPFLAPLCGEKLEIFLGGPTKFPSDP